MKFEICENINIRGPTVDRLWIHMESLGGVCLRVECPFRGGSVEAIFGLSYGPGTETRDQRPQNTQIPNGEGLE